MALLLARSKDRTSGALPHLLEQNRAVTNSSKHGETFEVVEDNVKQHIVGNLV